MQAPVAKKIPFSQTRFGITLRDDYAWLREKDREETIAYLEAENAYTDHMTAHTKALQETLYEEMLGRIEEDDSSVPYRKDSYWYYTRTEEGKAYVIHCRKKGSLDAPEEVILDENALAEGHEFFELGDLGVSRNEQLLAYTVDLDGSEKYALYVKDMRTGEVTDTGVKDIFEDFEWANDNRTLYYVRLEEGTHRPHTLFRHRIGGEGPDELVFHEEDASFFLGIDRTKDRNYLFIDIESMVTSEIHLLDAHDPDAKPVLFRARQKEIQYGLEHHEGWFYIITNEDAVNFRLLRTPADKTAREHWEEVIPHDPTAKIDDIETFRDHLVVYGRKNGLRNIQVRSFRTEEVYDIDFPDPAYVVYGASLPGFDTTNLRFHYSSLTVPGSVYDFDMETRERRLRKRTKVLGGFDPDNYVSERFFARARDGARIPISIVYRRDLAQNGPQPLLLYAYGSYGHSVEPYFSSSRISLLDRGVVFAIAHIRGGGELGRPWYEEGKILKKKNSFHDFIAAARHLIDKGYTSPGKLAISGGSAGGLLMGAVLNLRPELFKAVIAHVPFVDVINTMLDPSLPLTIIEYDEWGDPNKEEYFRYIHSYSPYDNVRPRSYPDMLITAGLNDPRVHYWEPAKWCARLRAVKTDDHILLLKTNMGAGHQGASGRYGHLKEQAFDYAFLLDRLGVGKRREKKTEKERRS